MKSKLLIRPILESRSRYERFKLPSHCYRFNSRLPTLLKYTLRAPDFDGICHDTVW